MNIKKLPDALNHRLAIRGNFSRYNRTLDRLIEYCRENQNSFNGDIHLYPKDYTRIENALAGSGFDVSKGFTIAGRKVICAYGY